MYSIQQSFVNLYVANISNLWLVFSFYYYYLKFLLFKKSPEVIKIFSHIFF